MLISILQQSNFTTHFLRGLVLFLALTTNIIWIRKAISVKTKFDKFTAILKVFAASLATLFVLLTIFNHTLFEIENWILNVLSNSVRVALLSGMLISGLSPVLTKKECPDELIEAINELKDL